jgi:Ca2+-binding RTX toxin-like protein
LQQQELLSSFGIANKLIEGYNEAGIANLIRSGRGVLVALDAGVLWDDPNYSSGGVVNHAVTVTGVVYGEADGALLGFYIADSGRHKVRDMTRFVDIETFRNAADVGLAYAIYTTAPMKQWEENIDGTGNAAANGLIGNRGDNRLYGMEGDDILSSGAGEDTLDGGAVWSPADIDSILSTPTTGDFFLWGTVKKHVFTYP